MPNEPPRFIDRIAGARPSHQRPGPRDAELPTLAAYLIIVFTRALEPDQVPSGEGKRWRSLRWLRRARW
jgi:hypothetical protein